MSSFKPSEKRSNTYRKIRHVELKHQQNMCNMNISICCQMAWWTHRVKESDIWINWHADMGLQKERDIKGHPASSSSARLWYNYVRINYLASIFISPILKCVPKCVQKCDGKLRWGVDHHFSEGLQDGFLINLELWGNWRVCVFHWSGQAELYICSHIATQSGYGSKDLYNTRKVSFQLALAME